jgi:cell division protein FtsI (penicillin-binding protein 3)
MKFEKRTPELRLKLEGWRSRFVLVAVIAGFALLAGRAFYLQAVDTGFLQAKGEARYGRVVEMPASRGPVKDRNGQLLAVSTAVESIWAIPDEPWTRARSARKLPERIASSSSSSARFRPTRPPT